MGQDKSRRSGWILEKSCRPTNVYFLNWNENQNIRPVALSRAKIFIFKIELGWACEFKLTVVSEEKIWFARHLFMLWYPKVHTQKKTERCFYFKEKNSAHIKTDFFASDKTELKKCITNRDFTLKNLIPCTSLCKNMHRCVLHVNNWEQKATPSK